MNKIIRHVTFGFIIILFTIPVHSQPPIADGGSKFLGNIHNYNQITDFTNYWNQVTPENDGKWGEVESSRDVMNWVGLDNAYNLAKDNDFVFRFHILIWGQQQPGWINLLDSAGQIQEIEEWFQEVSNRYDSIDIVEVVNEPLAGHNPPDGLNGRANYIDALGGYGVTGYDWVINSFKLAKKYFPNSQLVLNEYGIINSLNNVKKYLNIAKLLQADTLIDGLCFQAHAFSTKGVSASILKNNLDTLATAGLPIYVSEMDIDGETDLIQVKEYQRVFPVFWEHPAVQGITLWGWRRGLWRDAQGAYLINSSGTERPAMKWLKAYVNNTFVIATGLTLSPEGGIPEITSDGGTLTIIPTITPSDATIDNISWSVGNNSLAKISVNGTVIPLANGVLTVTATLLDGSDITESIDITISNQNVTTIESNEISSNNILIYPIPSFGNFTIETVDNITSVKILNITGEMVKNIPVFNKNSIFINPDLREGIYIIQVDTENNTYFRKIVMF